MKKKFLIIMLLFVAIITGCSKTKKEEYTIVDKSLEMDFSCAAVMERFYEDDKYAYSFSCMKSDYVVVVYEDKTEVTVKEALKEGKIKIEDLDKFDIKYYKSEK